jgi:tetratricopeptide (TPR) repeat protein
LAVEPHDVELLSRMAPLLAKTGQGFDAWQYFRRAAKARLKTQQAGEALSLYQEATRCLPRQAEAWQAVAQLELRRERRKRARDALLTGRRHFRSRRRRPEAIYLLRAAREIEPWDHDTVLDLAGLLAGTGQACEGQWLLDQLAERSSGKALRRIRGLQWRIEPSLRHTWHWMKAAIAVIRAPEEAVAA